MGKVHKCFLWANFEFHKGNYSVCYTLKDGGGKDIFNPRIQAQELCANGHKKFEWLGGIESVDDKLDPLNFSIRPPRFY